MENSVLIWTESNSLMTMTETIVSKHNLQLKEADCATDLIAIPCFFIIVDASFINKESVQLLHEMAKIMTENEHKILVIGDIKLPKRLWKFVEQLDQLPSARELENLIIEARELNSVYQRKLMNERFRYRDFDHTRKRIFRVWYIYNKLKEKNGHVNADHFSTIFNVSGKTIYRDIAILKDFGCVIDYDATGEHGSGFYLTESF